MFHVSWTKCFVVFPSFVLWLLSFNSGSAFLLMSVVDVGNISVLVSSSSLGAPSLAGVSQVSRPCCCSCIAEGCISAHAALLITVASPSLPACFYMKHFNMQKQTGSSKHGMLNWVVNFRSGIMVTLWSIHSTGHLAVV